MNAHKVTPLPGKINTPPPNSHMGMSKFKST